jgi:HEAT repeat protein
VRRAAILALGECDPADTVLLVPALARGVREDRDRACRNFAMVVLGRMGGPAAQDSLSRCYALGDRGERNFAALGLGILGRGMEDADARARIAAALRSDFINREDSDFRGALAVSLGLLRDAKAIPALRTVLKNRGDPELRAHCALALGLMGRMDAVPDLRAALVEKGSPALQREAALALGILGDAGAAKVLADLLAASGPEHVRASAARALGELGGESAADALLALLGDRSAGGAARGQAAVGLGIILDGRSPGALSSLSAGLDFLATTPAVTEALSIP